MCTLNKTFTRAADRIYSFRILNVYGLKFPLITKKNLLGTFYRPPNSTQDVLTSIEDSISLAYDTNIQNVLITGGFNLDVLKSPFNKKVFDLCQHFSLHQLINEPTRHTESSSSVIDLHLK